MKNEGRKDTIVLAFNLGFNSSAALYSSERGLVAAISQERLNGEKNTKRVPIEAMLKCCELGKVDKIDYIAYSHYQELSWWELVEKENEKNDNWKKYFDDVEERNTIEGYYPYAQSATGTEAIFLEVLKDIFKDKGIEIEAERLIRVEHHIAHQYCPFGIYGLDKRKHIRISSDGFGDGTSTLITEVDGGMANTLVRLPLVQSFALIYQFVTGALGYKMHQHEGKITGLAAFGEPIYMNEFYGSLFKESGMHKVIDKGKLAPLDWKEKKEVKESKIVDFEDFLRLKKTVFNLVEDLKHHGARNEDIAATVQKLIEDQVTSLIIRSCGGRFVDCNCFLSGGLFANVRLNQKIRELGIFKEVYVAPPMGDEGTAIGSALYTLLMNDKEFVPMELQDKDILKNVAIGTEMRIDELERIPFDVEEMEFENENELIDFISQSLANKKIVCLCHGKMEFGPRALCSRSILYECTDKDTNNWLNKQLSRTEFMPFAPVCQQESASKFFVEIENAMHTSRFMTMTFDCKKEFREVYKAATHVDGTARPQLVNKEEHPFMWKILEEYKKKTGLEALINTSFNLHNYPIIENAQDAMDSWYISNTDVLVINNTVFRRMK